MRPVFVCRLDEPQYEHNVLPVMKSTSRLLPAFLLIWLLAICPSHAASRQVALELVLAVDTSTSVDAQEFELQRKGLADAFVDKDVIAAIEAFGSLGIAVCVVEWAGTKQQSTVVDWVFVGSTSDAFLLSRKIQSSPRAIYGMTDIGSVLDYSANSIQQNDFEGFRKVIDVSGDGVSNPTKTSAASDRVIGQGITVNGLVIFNEEYDLGELADVELVNHYKTSVIGGPGAFLMEAQNFDDFASAIRQKLLKEIAGPATASLGQSAMDQ